MSFTSLSNADFLRFVINNEKSLVGTLHRESYMRAIVDWIAEHLCLNLDKSLQATEMGLADVYLDYKFGRIDSNAINLHYEGFNRAWRKAAELKKQEFINSRMEKERTEELNNYLTGLA